MKRTGDFILKSKHNDRSFIADARYLPDGNTKSIILFVHGFKGFKDWGHFNIIADAFAEAGFVFVKLNLSHNGTTPESPLDFVDLEAFSENNFSIEMDDVGILIDYLTSDQSVIPKEECNVDELHLIGHSRGGSVVLLKAAEEDRIKSVIAWAPVSDLKERWSTEEKLEWKQEGVSYIYNGRTKQNMPLKYQLLEDVINNETRLDVAEAVSSMKIPMLLTHGTDDTTLPYAETIQLSETNKLAQLQIIEQANHVFGGSHPFPIDQKELPEHTKLLMKATLDFLNAF